MSWQLLPDTDQSFYGSTRRICARQWNSVLDKKGTSVVMKIDKGHARTKYKGEPSQGMYANRGGKETDRQRQGQKRESEAERQTEREKEEGSGDCSFHWEDNEEIIRWVISLFTLLTLGGNTVVPGPFVIVHRPISSLRASCQPCQQHQQRVW